MGKNNSWLKSRDQVNGLLDKGCNFEGKIVFDGTVQINGEFSGEVRSEGTLVVGQDARLSADIEVDTLICYGRIDGKVNAKCRVEVHVPSVVMADIATRSLVIEEGAIFQGQCNMFQEVGLQASPGTGLSEADSLATGLPATDGHGDEVQRAVM